MVKFLTFFQPPFLDLAQHYFLQAGITAIRRVRKTDNNRISRSCGATIVNRVEELKESDIGTDCGLFEVRKIGDEYVGPFFLRREGDVILLRSTEL